MHDLPARARRSSQGRRSAAALLLSLAAAIGLSIAAPEAKAASPVAADPLVTGSIAPAHADHELRIEFTRQGSEGLELAARLDDNGGLVTRPIRWTVKRAVGSSPAAGEPVFSGEAPVADLRLRPGEYRIEASYGLARVAQDVAIHPGQWVGITLILHVGGVRALSLVDDQDLPASIAAAHLLYALSGRQAGQRVTAAGQGELVRLEAGAYRVESRLEPGNAVAETTVQVKPGVLSSLEIAHLAGLVRVELPRAGGEDRFEVRDLDGKWTWRGRAPGVDLVLAPGRYEARALDADEASAVAFAVSAGQSIVVLLGR